MKAIKIAELSTDASDNQYTTNLKLTSHYSGCVILIVFGKLLIRTFLKLVIHLLGLSGRSYFNLDMVFFIDAV